MSIVTFPSPTDQTAVLTETPAVEFERRWAAWLARGLAHDRVVRQRFIVVAIVTGAIALAVAIVYGLLWA